jgi:hypothetical protein
MITRTGVETAAPQVHWINNLNYTHAMNVTQPSVRALFIREHNRNDLLYMKQYIINCPLVDL